MAKLPTRDNLSPAASLRSGRQIAVQDTTGFARGLESVGADISALGQSMEQQQNTVDIARAEAYKTEQLLAAQNEFEHDPEYATFRKRAPKRTGEVIENGAQLIRDPKMRERWLEGARSDVARVNDSIYDRGTARKREAETVAFDEALEANRRLYVDPQTDEAVKAKARTDIEASIEAGLSSGLLTPDQAEARRKTFIDNADYNRGLLEVERDPTAITRPLPATVAERSNEAMSFFMSQGWNRDQAAAIVGNLIAESNLSTDARNPGDGRDGSDSVGIGQWNGSRARALKAYAGERGLDWRDFGVQLAFVQQELDTSERPAANRLKNTRNLDEATAAFVGYERPAGWSESNPRGAHNFSGRLKFAAMAAGEEVNPEWFKRLSPEQRQIVTDRAIARETEMQKLANAQAKAEYTTYKDATELSILTGKVTSELSILDDPVLNDGDKASLLRTFRTQMEDTLATAQAMSEFASGNLSVDPYDTKGRKTVDNVYGELLKAVPDEQVQAVTEDLVRQTGIVPKQAMSVIRQGMESTDVAQVEMAAQAAQRISTINPAALARRDGGKGVQDFADDFGYYVNTLNLSPEQAARRLMEARDPAKQRARSALEPAAKDFLKQVATEDVAAIFDDSWFTGAPDLGFSPAQEAGIKAEFVAIAEDEFFRANGDPELAKNRAVETMKRLYGVTGVTGRRVVMKHPPERYWPALRKHLGTTEKTLDYARRQLETDLKEFDPGINLDNVQLVTTPQTDAMVKRGELPGYAVLYQDDNGVLQTMPGRLWRPDLEAEAPILEFQERLERNTQEQRVERARRLQESERRLGSLEEARRRESERLGGVLPAEEVVIEDEASPDFEATDKLMLGAP